MALIGARAPLWCLLVLFLILLYIDWGVARGRGGRSSYSSGSRYSYSSYSRSSYRSASSYRSTSYSRYYRSSYQPSTYRTYRSYRSTYRAYTPVRRTPTTRYSYSRTYYNTRRLNTYYSRSYPVRYSRAYGSRPPSHYYPRYALYYNVYMSRSYSGSGKTVCRNYEANDNGTSLGLFVCPMPFEPSSFSYCCGDKNSEYCCSFQDVPANIAGVVVGVLVFLFICAGIGYCCYKKGTQNRRKVTPPGSTTVFVTNNSMTVPGRARIKTFQHAQHPPPHFRSSRVAPAYMAPQGPPPGAPPPAYDGMFAMHNMPSTSYPAPPPYQPPPPSYPPAPMYGY